MKPGHFILRILLGSLAFFPLSISASEPASTNTAPLPDLQTAGVKELIDSTRASLEQMDKDRIASLSSLLNRHLGIVTEMLAEKKKTRNVGGIAAATTGINILQTALTNLETHGKFELPDKVRRELESTVAQCKTEAVSIEAGAADKRKKLMDSTLEKFTAIAAANRNLTDAAKPALETRLAELLKSVTPAVPAPPSGASTNAPSPASTNAPAEPAQDLPDILAASGDARQWATVATWHGTMMGMDIVSIPVTNGKAGPNASRQFNPISGQDSELNYVVHHRLTPRDGVFYRLKRIPGTNGVELIEWPSLQNGYRLVVRARTTGQFPSHHAFDLQVGVTGGDLSSIAGDAVLDAGASGPKTLPPIVLTLITTPEGASIHVNDKLQQKVRTPCRFPLTPGDYSIKLTLPGFETVVMTNQSFTSNRTLRFTLQPDSRIQRKTVTVLANAPSWSPSGITVERGDTLVIRAEGQWACAPGREPCDASGYPNNEAFYRYYMDSASYPRLTSSAGYGALVMRIGETGRIVPLGKDFAVSRELRFGAAESGPVFFDINEKNEARFRADNNGTLILHISVFPSQPGIAPR